MADQETVWCIRAGGSSAAEKLFLEKKFVALGWPAMGDLSKIKPDREAFKAKLHETHPHEKPGAIPTKAGELFRFVHEMAVNDIVVYPSKVDRHVHIGRVQGNYKYGPELDEDYPHLRAVQWLKSVPRLSFTQGALYEIGGALAFFRVKTYADEFLAVLAGMPPAPPVAEDTTTIEVAEDIEETTRDFVLKRLAQELKGHPLEGFVAHLLQAMGYRTRVSPEGPDSGVDIIAHKDELGFEPPIVKVQVKSTSGSIGEPVVSQLNGKLSTNECGLLVTLGTFTPQARNFAQSKSNLRLIDGDELVSLIYQHYEQFDSRYKGLLPLKRVYVPQPIEEGNE
jgi:restriction system protein